MVGLNTGTVPDQWSGSISPMSSAADWEDSSLASSSLASCLWSSVTTPFSLSATSSRSLSSESLPSTSISMALLLSGGERRPIGLGLSSAGWLTSTAAAAAGAPIASMGMVLGATCVRFPQAMTGCNATMKQAGARGAGITDRPSEMFAWALATTGWRTPGAEPDR